MGGGVIVLPSSNIEFDNDIKYAFFVQGEYITLKSYPGWWLTLLSSWILADALPSLWNHYGYVPINKGIVDKQTFLNVVNNPYTWIVYYDGHGNWREETGEDEIWLNEDEVILPNTFSNADNKIVFLNACFAAHDGDLNSFFGIDGVFKWLNIPRKEILFGWNSEISIYSGDAFALDFWLLLGKGLTIRNAAAITADHHKLKGQWSAFPKNSDPTLEP